MSHGIKDTREAIEGILDLGLVMWRIFGDGAQISDAKDLIEIYKNNPEFVAKMSRAYEGYKNIPGEMQDLEVDEIVELGSLFLSYIPRYFDELKK